MMMRRRQKSAEPQESKLFNKELKKQGNILIPLIIALGLTLLLLLSSDSEEPDIALPEIQKKHKEDLILVPKEQAQLEVDNIIAEKAAANAKANAKQIQNDGSLFQQTSDGPFNPSLHDSTTLMQHIWYRGQKIEGTNKPQFINTSFPISIDALSSGSGASLVTMAGQVKTWGSHHSIRYFFGATELDDPNPTCDQSLTLADMTKLSEWCSGRAWRRMSPSIKFLRNRFVRGDFMVRFRKTPGWMCALQRVPHAISKLGRFYRNELSQPGTTFQLPHFLMIQDDDTFYNMLKLYPYLERKNPAQATADAGCLVRMPIAQITFDYPYGGFGLMLSRASIERWIRPLDCTKRIGYGGVDGYFGLGGIGGNIVVGGTNGSSVEDEWEVKACQQIKQNLIGESVAWKNGMSITDLMGAHAAQFPFVDFKKWKPPGYCIHGDWALGYFINYYGVAKESASFYKSNNMTRIEQTLGYNYDKPTGNCLNEGQAQCTEDAHVCHRLHGVSMSFVARLGKLEAPHQFRTIVK